MSLLYYSFGCGLQPYFVSCKNRKKESHWKHDQHKFTLWKFVLVMFLMALLFCDFYNSWNKVAQLAAETIVEQ
jgi:hypothetical protein